MGGQDYWDDWVDDRTEALAVETRPNRSTTDTVRTRREVVEPVFPDVTKDDGEDPRRPAG